MSPRCIWAYGTMGIQWLAGENCTRFTNTWSPIRSVFSIEAEGISNACRTKVIIKSPVTKTPASDARNSTVVSRGFSSFLSLFGTSFFGTVVLFERVYDLLYEAERAVPARDLHQMTHRIQKTRKFITRRGRS